MIDRVMVIGNGACAHRIASLLLTRGQGVIHVTREDRFSGPDTASADFKALERLTNTTIDRCEGHAGAFRITATRNQTRLQRTAAAVIIAEEPVRQSNIERYGMSGCPSVYSVSQISNRTQDAIGKDNGFWDRLQDKRIAFLIGLYREAHPACFAEALKVAHRLQSAGCRTFILSNNLKVAGNGLEAGVRGFKKAGGIVFKFSGQLPRFITADGHPAEIELTDEVTREAQPLHPDIVVVDETLCPSPYLERLGRIFALDTDGQGYLQTGNVHRLSVMTNRRGILAAGPSRSIQTDEQEEADAGAAAITALSPAASRMMEETDAKAEIDSSRCIRCLTCFRLCPHRAVSVAARVTVAPEACEGCGICASECPRGAIRIAHPDHAEIAESISRSAARMGGVENAPFLVAFCCSKSAAMAAEQAAAAGRFLPENLLTISVPCAGSISMDLILTFFRLGARGVLVLTCHEGNCRSERGNRFAGERAARVSSILSEIGMEKDRIGIDSLAANMGADFARRVRMFEQRIKALI